MHTWAFWRSYAVTARPYLLFVSCAAGLSGLALASSLRWPALTAAASAFFLSYGFGQALTDTTQMDTDALSAPHRPLVQGLVSVRQVAAVSVLGLLLCAGVLAALSVWTLVLAGAGIAGLATYTWFKRRWWAGPLYNAWIVALLPIMGWLCGSPSWRDALASSALAATTVSVFFSYAVFVLLGYLKDIRADRATGYDTFAVRFGWRPTIASSAAFALIALVASAQLVSLASPPMALWMWLAGVLALVVAHVLLMRTREEEAAHAGIAFSVRGFILLHLGEASAARPELSWPALALYALFEIALALRPERSQV
jgi:4-hydroxybenzoate polyprenyltransferase